MEGGQTPEKVEIDSGEMADDEKEISDLIKKEEISINLRKDYNELVRIEGEYED